MALIRGSSLVGFVELVSELGGDPPALLRQSGVQTDQAGVHEAFFPYPALAVVLERAAAQTRTPDFGRRLALRQGIEILGPVGVAARTAPTVGEALRISSVYLGAYSSAIEVRLSPARREEQQLLEFAIVEPEMPSCPQLFELSLGVQLQVLRHLCGTDYRPVSTAMPHMPLCDEASYREYYRSPVAFSQSRAGLVIRNTDLSRPVANDAQAHEVLLRYLDGLAMPTDRGLTDSSRRLVRELLPTGTVTMDIVARQFALHPKTFQRRLAEEGTTFGAQVEQVRRELTQHYLCDTDLDLTQIARELGYAEQSVLSRSCRRWFGTGPVALRAQLRGGRPRSASGASPR